MSPRRKKRGNEVSGASPKKPDTIIPAVKKPEQEPENSPESTALPEPKVEESVPAVKKPEQEPNASSVHYRYFVAAGRTVSCKTALFTRADSKAKGGIVESDVIGGAATLEHLVERGLLVKE